MITLNFYDENFVINSSKSLNELRILIGKTLNLKENDVKELILYYFNKKNQKNFVFQEDDFQIMKKECKDTTLFIEVSESSTLFKNEAHEDPKNINEYPINNGDKNAKRVEELNEITKILSEKLQKQDDIINEYRGENALIKNENARLAELAKNIEVLSS